MRIEVGPHSVEEERFWHNKQGGSLVHGLLLGQVQRPVGKVGVHPSAPMGENACRKQLKSKELGLFQNGTICARFEIGSPLAEMGRVWETSGL
jgi:hypothetical protein